ncbi:MAG TPA: hypothetical protein VNO51_12765 [Ilumatobacteraceae bacterium]|nr:hypothetical protein [Ilumatobacteraceae bacterium]
MTRSVAISLGVIALLSLSACGDDDDEAGTVDVSTTCDRVKDLGNAVLTIQSASTVEEVEETLAAPIAAFVEAAETSGDEELAELAATYEANFDEYLDAEGLDAREAADDVDVTLDRAAQRCIELGAMERDEFPQQP